MGEHFRSVTQDKPWVVAKGRRHVADLHPALSFPAQVLDFFRRHVLGAHHRSRTVILLQPLIRDQVTAAELLSHGRARIRRGVLDVRPIYIAAGEGEGGATWLMAIVSGWVGWAGWLAVLPCVAASTVK